MPTKNLLLIAGHAMSGKTASLHGLHEPEKTLYLNCENGKEISFNAKFAEAVITDPMMVHQIFQDPDYLKPFNKVVIDSLSFLMEMYALNYVSTAIPKEIQRAWGRYKDYFKFLMNYIAARDCDVIFTTHLMDRETSDQAAPIQQQASIQGSLKNTGIEAYFTCIVHAKKVKVERLEQYPANDLLHITEAEKRKGVKHVFQVQETKETMHELIRSPMGLWQDNEIFIDNNAQAVLTRIQQYYQ